MDAIETFFANAINNSKRRYPPWAYPEKEPVKVKAKRRRPTWAELVMRQVNKSNYRMYGLRPCYLRRIEGE